MIKSPWHNASLIASTYSSQLYFAPSVLLDSISTARKINVQRKSQEKLQNASLSSWREVDKLLRDVEGLHFHGGGRYMPHLI